MPAPQWNWLFVFPPYLDLRGQPEGVERDSQGRRLRFGDTIGCLSGTGLGVYPIEAAQQPERWAVPSHLSSHPAGRPGSAAVPGSSRGLARPGEPGSGARELAPRVYQMQKVQGVFGEFPVQENIFKNERRKHLWPLSQWEAEQRSLSGGLSGTDTLTDSWPCNSGRWGSLT